MHKPDTENPILTRNDQEVLKKIINVVGVDSAQARRRGELNPLMPKASKCV